LIDVHEPTCAGFKLMEPVARSSARAALQARQHIEGVLLQLSDERKLRVFAGALSSVAAQLDTKTAKDYLSRDDLRGIDWRKMNAQVKEAILAATAALKG
jgi:hypothetical protein